MLLAELTSGSLEWHALFLRRSPLFALVSHPQLGYLVGGWVGWLGRWVPEHPLEGAIEEAALLLVLLEATLVVTTMLAVSEADRACIACDAALQAKDCVNESLVSTYALSTRET